MEQVLALPESWVMIVALLIPVGTAVLTKYKEGVTTTARIVSLVLTVGLAVIGMLTDDTPQHSVAAVIGTIVIVGVTQLLAYATVGQPLKVNQRLAPGFGLDLEDMVAARRSRPTDGPTEASGDDQGGGDGA